MSIAPQTALIARTRTEWRRVALVHMLLGATAATVGLLISLILLDQLFSLPVTPRALLRLLPVLFLALLIARATMQVWPGPDALRLALLAEERHPELEHQLSTALGVDRDGPLTRVFLERACARAAALQGRIVRFDIRAALMPFVAAAIAFLLLLQLVPGGAAEIAARWLQLAPDPATGLGPSSELAMGRTSAEAAHELRAVRITVQPPAYTGGRLRTASADEPVQAVAGSVLRITGVVPPGALVSARVLGADESPVERTDDRFLVEHTLTSSDRGIEISALSENVVVARRVVPLLVSRDAEPQVELRQPDDDMVLATPSGTIRVEASARDDFGIADFRLTWILSRGSGESFAFTDGGTAWHTVRAEAGARLGTVELDLAALRLQPGDVLHVRAVARDGNTVTGPGEGVSRTRLIRVARRDEQSEATTLIGFPLEAEKDPILSQRMIVLLTERLIARAPGLSSDSLRVEADEIAHQQARLRERLADIIYARSSGEEAEDEHGTLESPLRTAADSLPPAERARRMEALLEAASRATGQGTLAELSHEHDPDPALAVNLPLLPAFNAMYEAERSLRQADPRAALPHERRALEIIQQVRESERIYLRGRQTVAPVDVGAVRGTGKLEEVDPAARGAGGQVSSTLSHAATISALSARLHALSARAAGLALSALSAQLLEDASVDARAGTLLARAAAAARAGDVDGARTLTVEARGVLVPGTGSAAASIARAPRSLAGLSYLAGLDGPDRVASGARTAVATPFVFATARYASGDWDSGQLVPANIIHALAQYTDWPVAPEGVVVQLDSPELFRHPFVFLTGHLPVRFTAAEAANVRTYVERGGFLFIDDHNHDIDGAFHRTVTAELTRVFGAGALQQLPTGHELYRTFFVFEDGPPTTSHELNGWGDGLIHEHLFAVHRADGRIGVLYSSKDYTSEWSYHVQNKRFLSIDNTRFGVNVVVYALTR
jgi:hypothetical protein